MTAAQLQKYHFSFTLYYPRALYFTYS